MSQRGAAFREIRRLHLFLRFDRKIEKFLENTLPKGTPYSE